LVPSGLLAEEAGALLHGFLHATIMNRRFDGRSACFAA